MEALHPDADLSLLARLGYAVLVTDRGGGVLWAGENLGAVTGIEAAELALRPVTELVAEEDRPHAAALLRSLALSADTPGAVPLRLRTGVVVEVAVADDGDPDLLAFVVRRDPARQALDEAVEFLADGEPLPLIMEAVARSLADDDHGATVVWERSDGRFTAAAHAGLAPSVVDAIDEAIDAADEPQVWDRYRPGHPAPTAVPLDQVPGALAEPAAAAGFASLAAVAVQTGHGLPEAIVVLWDRRPVAADGRLRPAVEARVDRARRLLVIALERDDDQRRLLDTSGRDPLTGLVTRSRFLAVLERQSHRGSLAMLGIDIDGFADINDRLGERVGDEVLLEVARRLEEVMRPTDVLARLGADDFAVLCADVDDDDVVETIANRVLDALVDPIPTTAGPIEIRASIGVATTRRPADAREVLVTAGQAVTASRAAGEHATPAMLAVSAAD